MISGMTQRQYPYDCPEFTSLHLKSSNQKLNPEPLNLTAKQQHSRCGACGRANDGGRQLSAVVELKAVAAEPSNLKKAMKL
jgi:hypothetical protein